MDGACLEPVAAGPAVACNAPEPPAVFTVSAACPPAPSKKRKGRTPAADSTTEAIRWNPEMTEELLRSRSEHRNLFLEAKNKSKIAQGWAKVMLDLKTRYGVAVNLMQIKNKYQTLQKLYRKHRQEDQATGNFPAVSKPLCWDAMVNHFGGGNGLSHDTLNSLPDPVPVEESDDEDLSDIVSSPISKKSGRRGSTPDRSQSINNLGLAIVKGLESLGTSMSAPVSAMDSELKQILLEHTRISHKTNELLEETKTQNSQLLKLALAQVELLSKSLLKSE